jgi:hypothetical protein
MVNWLGGAMTSVFAAKLALSKTGVFFVIVIWTTLSRAPCAAADDAMSETASEESSSAVK